MLSPFLRKILKVKNVKTPIYTGILWALAGLSNNVTFGRIGSTYYINASLFVWSLPCFVWLGLAWLALAGTAWQEVGASRKFSLHRSGRTYFFQVSSYLIGTLACFAWHGLAWLALAADTAGGRVVHHRSLFEQSEIFKFAFFCVLQQHNLGLVSLEPAIWQNGVKTVLKFYLVMISRNLLWLQSRK